MGSDTDHAAIAAQLESVVEQAPVGLGIWDRERRYVRVNAGLAQINGVSAEDSLGRTIAEVLPDLWPAVEDTFAAVIDRGETFTAERVRGLTPRTPGVEREWTVTYFPVHGADGDVEGAAAVIVETTDRWRAEQERDETLRQLEAVQRITDAALGSLELEPLLADLLARVCEATRAEAGHVLLTDRRGRRALRTHAVIGGSDDARALPGAERRMLEQLITDTRPFVAEGFDHELTVAGTRTAWALAVPLVHGDEVLGALHVGGVSSPRARTSDLDLLRLAATRCALAIAHSRVYTRERRIAGALQQALLPPALPVVEGLDLAARFRPAGDGLELGGDFYDVFRLAADRWVLVVGDVRGKGATAAAVTALARYTLRTAALGSPRPSDVLQMLNDALYREYDGEEFVTAALALLTVDGDGKVAVELVSAGHPEVLVRAADGAVRGLGLGSTVLGWQADVPLRARRAVLEPGDTLLLYTDGLLDAGAPGHLLTELELKRILAGIDDPDLDRAAEQLLTQAVSGTAIPRDDIALLMARPAPVPRPAP